MAFTTFVNFAAGKIIHTGNTKMIRKTALTISIIISLGLLFFFKYFPWMGSYLTLFFDGKSNEKFQLFLSTIVLPVGISFFTFQAMSYTIDLYYKRCQFCPSLLRFATYVSMFPQLVAGPIIRFRDIDHQLFNISEFKKRVNLSSGIDLFFRGLIKKVIFADQLGSLIDPSFVAGAEISTGMAWISILGYALQIYFDFSGYSDMAIGMGKCMGFKFPDNFLAPYTSKNPAEFWRRWHISLSTWLRDYLYIPMGGNRHGEFNTLRNLLITMFLGGLWHGASFTFIIWGLIHGMMLVIHRITPSSFRQKIPSILSLLLLNLGVVLAWVFFRLPTVEQAFSFYKVLFGFSSGISLEIPRLLFLLIAAGYLFHFLERKDYENSVPQKTFFRAIYVVTLAMFSIFGILELGKDTPFIYFQF